MLLALSAGCGGGDSTARPPAPTVLEISMTEYRFAYEQAEGTLPRGRFVLRARNTGALEHELLVVRLPDGFSGSVSELVGSRRALPELARERRPPGGRLTVALDLPPGRYGLLCLLKDDGGGVHAAKGMASDLRVR